jgi:hypothetical protein
MKRTRLGFFERYHLQEEIARQIYAELGYTVDQSKVVENYMEVSQHPTEIACYRAAGKVIDKFAVPD